MRRYLGVCAALTACTAFGEAASPPDGGSPASGRTPIGDAPGAVVDASVDADADAAPPECPSPSFQDTFDPPGREPSLGWTSAEVSPGGTLLVTGGKLVASLPAASSSDPMSVSRLTLAAPKIVSRACVAFTVGIVAPTDRSTFADKTSLAYLIGMVDSHQIWSGIDVNSMGAVAYLNDVADAWATSPVTLVPSGTRIVIDVDYVAGRGTFTVDGRSLTLLRTIGRLTQPPYFVMGIEVPPGGPHEELWFDDVRASFIE